jgi:hypothetical protein
MVGTSFIEYKLSISNLQSKDGIFARLNFSLRFRLELKADGFNAK